MRSLVSLLLYSLLLVMSARAEEPPKFKISAELKGDSTIFYEFEALIVNNESTLELSSEGTRKGEIEAKFNDTLTVTITMKWRIEDQAPWIEPESPSLRPSEVILKCCGAELQLDDWIDSMISVTGPEDPGGSITKTVVVLKPRAKSPTPPKPNPNSEGEDPQSGGPGSGGMNGSNSPCSSCSGLPTGGGMILPIPMTSATAQIGLGEDAIGRSLGALVFHKPSVHNGDVTSSNFSVRSIVDTTRSFNTAGGLTQVVSEAAIISLAYPASDTVVVNAYDISAKGAPVNSAQPNGPFVILSNAAPLATYTFSGLTANSDGAGISLVKTVAGDAPLTWTLRALDGSLGRTWRAVNWDGEVTTGLEIVDPQNAPLNTQWERNVTISKLRDGHLTSKENSLFRSGPRGERLISRTEGDVAFLARVTSYDYYGATASSAVIGKLRYVIEPSGNWKKYDYDSAGDVVAIYQPWLDQVTHPDNATLTNCRVTEYNGPITTESILGQVVATTTLTEDVWAALVIPGEENPSYFQGISTEKTTAAGGYSWSGRFSALKGESLSVEKDGTGRYRSARENGTWNAGTKVFTSGVGSASRSWQGNVYKLGENYEFVANRSTRIVTITNNGRPVYESEEVYDGTQWSAFSHTEYSYDAKGRRTAVIKDGDTISSTVFHSNRAWTETNAKGVDTRYELSADGRTQTTILYGVGGAENIQTVDSVVYSEVSAERTVTTTAGSSTRSITTVSESDLLGRQVSSSDDRGRTTGFSYGSDHRSVTKTLPGGIVETTNRFLDGRIKSVISNGKISQYFSYQIDGATKSVITRIDYGQTTSVRWVEREADEMGNVLSERKPGPNGNTLTTSYGYDLIGRLVSQGTTGLATKITAYNAYGEEYRVGYDENSSNALEESSADPLIEGLTLYRKIGSNWWKEVTNKQWVEDGVGEIYETSSRERLGLGADREMVEVDRFANTLTTTVDVNRASKTVTTTTDSSLSNLNAVEVSVGERITSKTSLTNPNAILFEYDNFGRVKEIHDPASGITIYTYDNYDQTLTITSGNATTTYTYYPPGNKNSGALRSVTDPTNRTIYQAHDALGRLTHTWGATYPVRYEYNDYGQQVKMHTYRAFDDTVTAGAEVPAAFAGEGDVTEWIFQEETGLLLKKENADGKGTSYTYANTGLPHTRVWARGTTATYTFDALGRLKLTDYSDSTPDIDRTYDRSGRPVTVSGGPGGTHTLSYTGAGGEEHNGGILDGISITNNLDFGRPAGQTVSREGIALASNTFSYDVRGRVDGVSLQSDGQTIGTTYGYHPTHGRIESVATGNSATMTTVKVWDAEGRLESITTTGAASAVISGRIYQRDDAGRITHGTLPGGAYWVYGYDGKGQVDSSVKRLSNGAAIYGLGSGYVFDDIGNRKSMESTANLSGQQPIGSVYTPNNRNQYTGITHSSRRFVLGEAIADSVIEINGTPAARQGDWFAATVPGSNSTGPAWASVTVNAKKAGAGAAGADLTKSNTGGLYLRPASETTDYDDDGNLTSDGRWDYTWDAENRLIAMQTNAAAAQAGLPVKRIEYVYDGDSRRIGRSEFKWDAAASQFVVDSSPMRYIWKDWTLLAELKFEGATTVLARSYSWGLDVLDSLGQTGNVGNLLAIVDRSGSQSIALLPAYDGNGNIIALVRGSDASLIASYDYNAFGEQVVRTNHAAWSASYGEVAKAVNANDWGFSTKQNDKVSGLLYYGFRHYDPMVGRWLSRDPIQEAGSVNLYGFLANDGVNELDRFGLVGVRANLHIGWAYTDYPHSDGSGTARVNQWSPQVTFKFYYANETAYRNDKYEWLFSVPDIHDDDVIEWPDWAFGSTQKAAPGSVDTGGSNTQYASKVEGESIGGVMLSNLRSIGDLGKDGNCVQCNIYELNYSHQRSSSYLSGGGDIAGTIADLIPGGKTAGRAAQMAGNIADGLATGLGAADTLSDLYNQLTKNNRARIRGVICADGKRQIAVFNTPASSGGGSGSSASYISGGWLDSDPGGKSGLINSPIIVHED